MLRFYPAHLWFLARLKVLAGYRLAQAYNNYDYSNCVWDEIKLKLISGGWSVQIFRVRLLY
jgi:hypothetical protein